ncbi:MAG: hypothetical protein HONBIEJF_02726 [Fimbriimonadaceae bacterium]|nr:hypothetical protein [Fimbriimonadaceae bacterium]
MTVYRITATNSDNQHLMPAIDKMPLGLKDPRLVVGPNMPEDWTPPPLVHMLGKKKIDADFWDYDQGVAFTVSRRVAEALAGEEWCRLVPFVAEAYDAKLKPSGEISGLLLAVTRLVDAVDRDRTRFKPYGNEVLDFDTPGATAFLPERLPHEGMFLHRSGASTVVLAAEAPGDGSGSFRAFAERASWSGLRFLPV